MDRIIIWNLMRTDSTISFSERNGIWHVELDMQRVAFTAPSQEKAQDMAIRGLKRYICALIQDLEKIQSRGGQGSNGNTK